MTQLEGKIMTTTDSTFPSGPEGSEVNDGKYADYTAAVDTVVSTTNVYFENAGTTVRRVYYRIFRIPSEKRFVVRLFHDATGEDRADIEEVIHRREIGAHFCGAEIKGTVRRYRRKNGTYGYRAAFGRLLEDPLMQLELEAMIDLTTGVTTLEDARQSVS